MFFHVTAMQEIFGSRFAAKFDSIRFNFAIYNCGSRQNIIFNLELRQERLICLVFAMKGTIAQEKKS